MKYKLGNKTINVPDIEIEKLQKIGLTKEEAIQTYLDDEGYTHNEEQEESIKKSKQNGRHYEQSKVRKKVVKERKVDETKGSILTATRTLLEELGAVDIKTKTETEISFNYGDESYTFKLTKHRKTG